MPMAILDVPADLAGSLQSAAEFDKVGGRQPRKVATLSNGAKQGLDFVGARIEFQSPPHLSRRSAASLPSNLGLLVSRRLGDRIVRSKLSGAKALSDR